MSSSNKTPNLGLPIYTKGNRPTYLGDWNKTMNILDSSQGTLVTDVNGLKTDVSKNTGDIQVVQSTITTIENDIACAQEKIRQHTTEINNLTGRVAALEQGGASEEEITQIKEQIITINNNLTTLQSEIDENMGDIANLEADLKMSKITSRNNISSAIPGMSIDETMCKIGDNTIFSYTSPVGTYTLTNYTAGGIYAYLVKNINEAFIKINETRLSSGQYAILPGVAGVYYKTIPGGLYLFVPGRVGLFNISNNTYYAIFLNQAFNSSNAEFYSIYLNGIYNPNISIQN